MINYGAERAVYRQLADLLRDRIRAGQHLPSTLHIGQEYGLGRTTVRRALDVLVSEGLIVVRTGYGPVVVEQSSEVETIRLYRGSEVDVRLPTEADRAELGIPQQVMTPVIEVTLGGRKRLYRADRARFTSA
ncbi:GntR family transcriptional regulator [Micromonospora rubida]